jgi:diguanylate cyclase (GGDEF)-like protein
VRKNDQQVQVKRRTNFKLFPGSTAIPLPVYREFVDMLYSMWLPIFGLGVVFIAVCILAAFQLGEPIYGALAAIGAVTIFLRLAIVRAYERAAPVRHIKDLRGWERRYAIGNYASAAQLALLNVLVLAVHDPLLQLITVSLIFSFGAGVVARTSVRPKVCVISLLTATLPTIAALALHAFGPHSDGLHMEMYLVEALLVAMITGLSLQTVAHLYRTAVEHHTTKHDLGQLAKLDSLTGLANRLSLRERFKTSITAASRNRQLLAVHILDLDGFKAVNDHHGHPVGGALLQQVARRLEAIVRTEDTVARLGGDEFVVLQTGLLHEDEAKIFARRIIRQLSLPYGDDESITGVSASVGIATAPKQGVELERLLACADAALYRAKTSGKARAKFCNRDDEAKCNIAA